MEGLGGLYKHTADILLKWQKELGLAFNSCFAPLHQLFIDFYIQTYCKLVVLVFYLMIMKCPQWAMLPGVWMTEGHSWETVGEYELCLDDVYFKRPKVGMTPDHNASLRVFLLGEQSCWPSFVVILEL